MMASLETDGAVLNSVRFAQGMCIMFHGCLSNP